MTYKITPTPTINQAIFKYYNRRLIMTEPKKELSRTIIKDQKVIFGEWEFSNLISTLVRVYRFRCGNQTPEAIVMPDVREVEGVKVEFPEAKPTEVEKMTPEENKLYEADKALEETKEEVNNVRDKG